MSETTKTPAAADQAAPHAETDPVAGLDGAASFADAETREILNLLGNTPAGGSCCGGSCCA
ncbi:hypothetical protein FM113_09085 [Leucobacter sp. 7(1)]|uniref:hypothetical protein n=1 Tax=Leucobacter sp. 7(1) TaxID=1255613 RepID=UPI00097EB25A|nr:hypothetical protein [Leucobacter sp. 7(1)]SJN10426.1 hypothetical protein FM113_09085 [Leucobacter sp. 7(1)]